MKCIGVVGAGTMGAGIAYIGSLAGLDVILCDLSETILEQAGERLAADFRKGIEKGKISGEEAARAKVKIQSQTSLEPLGACECVIEAVIEDLDIKRELFRKLESICPNNTILASNTSSL